MPVHSFLMESIFEWIYFSFSLIMYHRCLLLLLLVLVVFIAIASSPGSRLLQLTGFGSCILFQIQLISFVLDGEFNSNTDVNISNAPSRGLCNS